MASSPLHAVRESALEIQEERDKHIDDRAQYVVPSIAAANDLREHAEDLVGPPTPESRHQRDEALAAMSTLRHEH